MVGGQTLLDATLARARRVAGQERVWIVCGSEHAGAVRKQSGLPASRVLVEPRRRNTAMAVAWAAHRILRDDPDAVMIVLPADHHVPDVAAFARDLKRAGRAADRERVLVTIGVEPTRPDTGYGYINLGARVKGGDGLNRVRRFVEKPSAARARRYLADGGYRWNAGIFAWRADVLLEEIETHAPDLHRALAPFRAAKGRGALPKKALDAVYRRSPSLPVDVAVFERSKRVWSLPVRWSWSDVGTWESLADELGVGTPGGGPAGKAGNRVIAGEVLMEDAHDNLVWGGSGRVIALLGVEDLAVVDTEDVILVTKLERSPDVRRLVEGLKKKGRDELT